MSDYWCGATIPPRSWPTYRCWSHPTRSRYAPWSPWPGVAGLIEESFQAAKGQAGLDEHQVRTWTSWRRWTILSMLALAFLAVTCADRARQHTRPTRPDSVHPQRVSTPLRQTRPRPNRHHRHHLWAWSLWRRKHQATARANATINEVRTPMTTIYGCSTNGASPQPDEACLWSPSAWGLRSAGETVTGSPVRCMNRIVRLVGRCRPPVSIGAHG